MKRYLLIVSFFALVQPAISQFQHRFQHFDSRDGLPSDLSNGLTQDSLGFLWTQHTWGISRYDGYSFKVYRYSPDDSIRSLGKQHFGGCFLDHSGNLWVTSEQRTPDFQLNRYDGTIDGFRKYKVPLDGWPRHRLEFEKDNKVIWITSAIGLYSFNTENNQTKNFVNPSTDSVTMALTNDIYDISLSGNSLLLATGKGLWKFDLLEKKFSRPKCDPKDSLWLYNTAFYDIYDTRSIDFDNVWLVDDRSLTRVNKDLSVIQRLELPGGRNGIGLMGFDMDKEGVFWLGTWNSGLCRYDPSDSSIRFIAKNSHDPHSIRTNRVNNVRIDRDQNIWITSSSGLSKLQRRRMNFHNATITNGKIDLSMLYTVGKSDFLIIDRNDGEHHIMIAPIDKERLDSFQFKQVIPTFQGSQGNAFWRGKRNFWISVWGQGVLSVPIDSLSGMIESKPLTRLTNSPSNPNTISTDLTTSLWEDGDENLWVGSQFGLNKIVPGIPYGSAGSVVRYEHNDLDPNSIADNSVGNISPEDQTSFWINSPAGVDLYHNQNFQHFFQNKPLPTQILKSAYGYIFIATAEGLYGGKKIGDRYVIDDSPIIKNIDVVTMKDDHNGRLWMLTRQGITCYDLREKIAIQFNENDGLAHRRGQFPANIPILTSQGIMVISDHDGLTSFEPSTLRINRKKTFPLLTRISVNNQTPPVGSFKNGDDQYSLSTDVSILEELVLDYQHNNFTLEFSSMELTSPEKNLYRHKLEGFDEEWIETDWKNRTATYTNLDAGTYTFRVKASNYHGIWSDNERVLSVIILPPPWKTWWAYTLYAVAFISVFLYWRSIENKKLQLRHRTKYLSELDTLKTRFFQNISHEFRTPITLIVSPLKELYGGKFKGDLKSTYGIMLRNGNRLLRLINQLLDLSKLEAGKMQLNTTVIDLVEFLRETAAAYESMAANKNIKYSFDSDVARLPILADEEKLEKVFHNLLSNAFKFTKEGGEISIRLTVAENKQAVISVRDTGIGIPADQLIKVFDRFYQVDSSQTREYEGSGLGMALAKEFVELHHGKISVESKEGQGSTFTVKLPLGKEELIEQAFKLRNSKTNKLSGLEEFVSSEGETEITSDEEAAPVAEHTTTILIVEDNADMRNYIRKTLSVYYQIIEAKNGKEGFQKATELLPDLIISDVMMPEMDGYKLCTLIKTNELTSHLPVILLTAKADRESKLTGLETQADDYLSKPFDVDELLLIVRNHIEERRKMRERFSREIKLEPKHISITSLDEKFITNVLTQLESHMGDENFSIEELSIQAGYSTMHLYRKIKSLTGQTPSQFVRTIRLKRAAELLTRKSDNISQIAYQVGFSNVSYFNKCFKDQFEMTPGDFLKTNHVER